jgi:uncharacterized membrane protein YeaQ/YmgE (transglycosylase-associated protein family)
MLWTIIVTIVGGAIIGLLGKFLAPGDRDNIPFWLTVVCGIVGMLVGSLLYYGLFGVAGNVKGNPDYGWDNTTKGIDWWRHVWQVVVAALAVMAASFLTGRSRRRV